MRNYQIEEWCAGHKGSERYFHPEWNALLYRVGGKMFALIGHDSAGEEIISLKNKPETNIALITQFEEISPGYYLNKTHWISIRLNGEVPENVLEKLIAESYECVLKTLPKKQREQIKLLD